MAFVSRRGWAVGLALGMLLGLVLGGLWPNTPLHATATDRAENFCIATGLVDDAVEGVFVLNFSTGFLYGAVPSSQTPDFQARFQHNVLADLATSITTVNVRIKQENVDRKKRGLPARPEVQLPQNPKFMMVTGLGDLRRGAARMQPGRCLVYVAEVNTGVLLAYATTWSPGDRASNRPFLGKFILWGADQFAIAETRAE